MPFGEAAGRFGIPHGLVPEVDQEQEGLAFRVAAWPRTGGRLPVVRCRAAYGDETFTRLVAFKNTYDPTNVFHLNQTSRPTR